MTKWDVTVLVSYEVEAETEEEARAMVAALDFSFGNTVEVNHVDHDFDPEEQEA